MCETTMTLEKPKRQPKVDPSTIRTYWNAYITYGEPENPDRSGCGFGGETFEECLSQMFSTGTYYCALGYKVKCVEIVQNCYACNGCGFFQKKFKRHTCKSCKGIGSFARTGSFPLLQSGAVGMFNSADPDRITQPVR
jgi:hypothetical protein